MVVFFIEVDSHVPTNQIEKIVSIFYSYSKIKVTHNDNKFIAFCFQTNEKEKLFENLHFFKIVQKCYPAFPQVEIKAENEYSTSNHWLKLQGW